MPSAVQMAWLWPQCRVGFTRIRTGPAESRVMSIVKREALPPTNCRLLIVPLVTSIASVSAARLDEMASANRSVTVKAALSSYEGNSTNPPLRRPGRVK